MRLSIWLQGNLRSSDGAAAPAGVAIEALVTDCPIGQMCKVGQTLTDHMGAFELWGAADVDAQLGRQPGESSALFVQARSDGGLVATANVCWIEDMPAGRAVAIDLMAAKAIKVPAPAAGVQAVPALAATAFTATVPPPTQAAAYAPAAVARPELADRATAGGRRAPRNVLAEFLGPAHALSGVAP